MASCLLDKPSLMPWQSAPVMSTCSLHRPRAASKECHLHGHEAAGAAECLSVKQIEAGSTLIVKQITNHRPRQEDCWAAQPVWDNLLLGVWDGHGGPAVSQFCSSRLPSLLKDQLARQAHANWSAMGSPRADQAYSGLAEQQVQQALVHAFEECDAAIPESDAAEGGSTATCVLLGPNHIWAANCGDSRAVIARKGQPVVSLTEDHKPERPDEEARIKEAGGLVFWNGGHRVMGVLSMSRAMGDLYLKQYGVIATPEVVCVHRHPDDQFLLMASDGLWSVLSSQDAVGLAQECISRAEARGADRQAALRVAAQVLVKAAVQQGSSDNITIILCDLTNSNNSQSHTTKQQHQDASVALYVPVSACNGQAAPCSKPLQASSNGTSSTLLEQHRPAALQLPGVPTTITTGGEAAKPGAAKQHAAGQAVVTGAPSPKVPGPSVTTSTTHAAVRQASQPTGHTSQSDEAALPTSGPRALRRSITTPTSQKPKMLQLLQLLHMRSLSQRQHGSKTEGGSCPGAHSNGADASAAPTRSLQSFTSGKRSISEPPEVASPADGTMATDAPCPSPTKRARLQPGAVPTSFSPVPQVSSPSSDIERVDSPGPASPGAPPSCLQEAEVASLSLRVVCMPLPTTRLRSHGSGLLDRSTERLLLAVDSPMASPPTSCSPPPRG